MGGKVEAASTGTALDTPLAAAHTRAGAKMGVWLGCALPDTFGDPAAEFRQARESVARIDKNYRAYLSFTGPDRVRYLNAVLTKGTRDSSCRSAPRSRAPAGIPQPDRQKYPARHSPTTRPSLRPRACAPRPEAYPEPFLSKPFPPFLPSSILESIKERRSSRYATSESLPFRCYNPLHERRLARLECRHRRFNSHHHPGGRAPMQLFHHR